jgi:hypothetical protein
MKCKYGQNKLEQHHMRHYNFFSVPKNKKRLPTTVPVFLAPEICDANVHLNIV